MAITDFLSSAIQNANVRVQINSNLTPPIDVNLDGGGPKEPGSSPSFADRLLSFVAPSIKIETSLGSYVVQPYGEPTEGAWVFAAAVGAIVGTGVLLLAGYGAVKLLGGK